MAGHFDGLKKWSMVRDEEGHRTYKAIFGVWTDDPGDGPLTVLATPGLPTVGSTWSFFNDNDPWAFCTPDARVEPRVENEKGKYWTVEFTFTTKPLRICSNDQIEDPLLIPPKVSGSYVKYTKEAVFDRHGEPIENSAHEMFRGQQVEFDANRPNVKIQMNVANLDLGLITSMVDTVNDSPLWGLPKRCIKLSNVSWERKYYGTCYKYYTVTYEFDINYNTFDRYLLDEGTKVLNGHWDEQTGAWVLDPVGESYGGTPIWPDPDNPAHFIRYKDRRGENARVILNGAGLPAESTVVTGTGQGTGQETGSAGKIKVEYYKESNFLLLGIPTQL